MEDRQGIEREREKESKIEGDRRRQPEREGDRQRGKERVRKARKRQRCGEGER